MFDILYISAGIYAVSMAISAVLLYIYAKNYGHIKSNYNIGLMIFATLFLVDNIISLHQTIFAGAYLIDDPAIVSHIFLQDVIDLIGLGTLLYITWK
jgi:hypothetical protein